MSEPNEYYYEYLSMDDEEKLELLQDIYKTDKSDAVKQEIIKIYNRMKGRA